MRLQTRVHACGIRLPLTDWMVIRYPSTANTRLHDTQMLAWSNLTTLTLLTRKLAASQTPSMSAWRKLDHLVSLFPVFLFWTHWFCLELNRCPPPCCDTLRRPRCCSGCRAAATSAPPVFYPLSPTPVDKQTPPFNTDGHPVWTLQNDVHLQCCPGCPLHSAPCRTHGTGGRERWEVPSWPACWRGSLQRPSQLRGLRLILQRSENKNQGIPSSYFSWKEPDSKTTGTLWR